MPANLCRRLDDVESALPLLPVVCEYDPEDAVPTGHLDASVSESPAEDADLLPERKILQGELPPGPKG